MHLAWLLLWSIVASHSCTLFNSIQQIVLDITHVIAAVKNVPLFSNDSCNLFFDQKMRLRLTLLIFYFNVHRRNDASIVDFSSCLCSFASLRENHRTHFT